MRALRSFWVWALVVVAFFAVTVVVQPAATTNAARIAHLETLVKCPSCDGISVADSTTESSLAVRAEITRMVHQGISDAEILTTLQDQYGVDILLSPRISGVAILLVVVPIVVVVGGLLIFLRVARRKT